MQASSTITKLTDQKADPPGTGRIEPGTLVSKLKLANQLPIKPGREGRREGPEKKQTVTLVEFSTWEQEENKCLLLTKILAT